MKNASMYFFRHGDWKFENYKGLGIFFPAARLIKCRIWHNRSVFASSLIKKYPILPRSSSKLTKTYVFCFGLSSTPGKLDNGRETGEDESNQKNEENAANIINPKRSCPTLNFLLDKEHSRTKWFKKFISVFFGIFRNTCKHFFKYKWL